MNAKQQGRLDGFFSVKPKAEPAKKDKAEEKGKGKGTKRKVYSLPHCAHSEAGHNRNSQAPDEKDKKDTGSKKTKKK